MLCRGVAVHPRSMGSARNVVPTGPAVMLPRYVDGSWDTGIGRRLRLIWKGKDVHRRRVSAPERPIQGPVKALSFAARRGAKYEFIHKAGEVLIDGLSTAKPRGTLSLVKARVTRPRRRLTVTRK